MKLLEDQIFDTLNESLLQVGTILTILRKVDNLLRHSEIVDRVNNLYCYLENQKVKYQMVKDRTYPIPYNVIDNLLHDAISSKTCWVDENDKIHCER